MLLAVDVGNSHMVIGLFAGRDLRCHWRMKTDASCTVDELAALFHGLFAMEKLAFADIRAIAIASVVPPMALTWKAFTAKYLHCEPLMVTSATAGIAIRTDNPAEVGADRLVNAVAAYHEYHGPLIIVDFGTAITFDCVAADGAYLGGVIAPGMAISLEALGSRTAKLPRVDISTPPPQAIGTNTIDAIKAGILYGYAGLIEGLIKRIQAEMAPAKARVIATGGMAALIAPYTEAIEAVDPMLTLKGLQILHEQNQ